MRSPNPLHPALAILLGLILLSSCSSYHRLNRMHTREASELIEDYGHHVLWNPEQNDPQVVDSMKRVIREYVRKK